jgi:hypothetical protein
MKAHAVALAKEKERTSDSPRRRAFHDRARAGQRRHASRAVHAASREPRPRCAIELMTRMGRWRGHVSDLVLNQPDARERARIAETNEVQRNRQR